MKYIKNFRTLGFYKLQDGEEYYRFTSIRNNEKVLAYRKEGDAFFLIEYNRKPIEVMPEAKEQLLKARKEFIDILSGILNKDGSFHIAKGENYAIAYRKELRRDCKGEIYLDDKEERNDFYRFITFYGNGKVVQYLSTFEDLNGHYNLTAYSVLSYHCKRKKLLSEIRDGSLPIFQSAQKHDRYLYLTMKYMAGIATQEEADEATAVDRKVRFVPEDKVYGEGITVSNVEQFHLSFFNRSERYSCKVTIGSRAWSATWFPNDNKLYIWQYLSDKWDKTYIKISDELKESIAKQAVKKYFGTWR